MEFSLSQHALDQMSRRGISEEVVKKVIDFPDQRISEENYTIYQKIEESDQGKYLIRVFVNIFKVPPLVITVYRTSKITKYHENKI
ncbi:MAG: DUF4258 domain-containing protein [Bacteroidales bacterium]|nr:DUF4258 domain-containing protein [Bacteroidales bacterium]